MAQLKGVQPGSAEARKQFSAMMQKLGIGAEDMQRLMSAQQAQQGIAFGEQDFMQKMTRANMSQQDATAMQDFFSKWQQLLAQEDEVRKANDPMRKLASIGGNITGNVAGSYAGKWGENLANNSNRVYKNPAGPGY